MPSIISLRPRQFAEKLADEPDAVLLDVRTPEEFNAGHITGAINLNFEDDSFRQKVTDLDQSTTYFVSCRAGNRSLEFCKYLLQQGFAKVYNLEAGIFSWVNYGYEIGITEKPKLAKWQQMKSTGTLP